MGAQQALGLHPSSTTPGPDGNDPVKKILDSVTGIAVGVAELRNRGYGTGHGAAGTRVGLHARPAHLAVNAAITWCQLMLDTLADSGAPGRSRPWPHLSFWRFLTCRDCGLVEVLGSCISPRRGCARCHCSPRCQRAAPVMSRWLPDRSCTDPGRVHPGQGADAVPLELEAPPGPAGTGPGVASIGRT